MRENILIYIEIRDRYLREFRADPSHPMLAGRLRIANDAVREFSKLTPGPTTPVLNPDEAAVQLHTCAQVDQLLAQAPKSPPPRRWAPSVPSVVSVP